MHVSLPYAETQGVPVGCRAGGPAGTDAAVRATYILDDDGLTERSPHALGHDAPGHVCQPARSKRNDHRDWPRRIVLCPGEPRDGGERGSSRGQMQKLTARKIA